MPINLSRAFQIDHFFFRKWGGIPPLLGPIYPLRPRWDEAAGGFDAIVQLRSDRVHEELLSAVHAVRRTADASRLSRDLRATLESIADSNAERTLLPSRNSGLIPHTILFEADSVELVLAPESTELKAGTTIRGSLHAAVRTRVHLRETYDSWRIRRRAFDSGPYHVVEPRREKWVDLSEWAVRQDFTGSLEDDSRRGRFWASVTELEGAPVHETSDETQAELTRLEAMEELETALRALRGAGLTPTFSLLQDGSYSRVDGADRFELAGKITARRGGSFQTLHLCVSLRSDAGADIGRVQTFHGGSSFGYYASSGVVEQALRIGWERLPDASLEQTVTTPVALARDDNPIEGEADVTISLTSARDIELITHPERSDHPRMFFDARIALNELRDDRGDTIPLEGEFAELTDPQEFDIDAHLLLFDDVETSVTEDSLIAHALQEMSDVMVRPVPGSSSRQLRIADGRFSQPIGAMFLWGELA